MTNSVPIEVWERILRYSIAVPLFFDSDPIVEHGLECLPRFCFEAEYWDSERTRNNCRRVCRSWDTFLQPYNHRYVRLSDIYFGRIPSKVLSMAIRLNLSPDLGFEKDIGEYDALSHMEVLVRSYITPTGKDRGLLKGWRMEILEGESPIQLNEFISCLKKAPQLRALLTPVPRHGRPTAGLRFLYMDPTWAPEPLVLQHLTTLHVESFAVDDVSFKDWQLPSLQHLSIGSPIDEDGFSDRMLEIVQVIGKNLITLHFQGTIPDSPTPNIWPHIPHVKHIQMPYWKGTSIPADHPARIVTIPIASLVYFIKNGEWRPAMHLFNYLPHPNQFSSHCLVVKMDVTWFAALMGTLFTRNRNRPRDLVASAIWLAGYYKHLGVKFTDLEGVDLQYYLIFATNFYWKGGRASVHKRKRYTATTLDF